MYTRCVAQQEGEKLLRRVPEIDLVMGPQYANRLGDLLEDVMNGNQARLSHSCMRRDGCCTRPPTAARIGVFPWVTVGSLHDWDMLSAPYGIGVDLFAWTEYLNSPEHNAPR